jgi:4'-phosphopantetheinyl transferase
MLVLHSSLNRLQDPGVFAQELARLPDDEQRKILRRVRPDDQKAALLGRMLLREGLARLGLEPELVSHLRYTRFGKPFLSEKLSFNISHSGQHVVCALSTNYRVGIDLEAERAVELEDFTDCMTDSQWREIRGAADPSRRFLEFWTMKEGLVKCQGEGLNLPLKEIEGAGLELTYRGEAWYTQPLNVAPGYVCHLTTKGNPGKPVVQHL